jgi:hypothetical protein
MVNIFIYISLGYLALWLTFFFHELTHSTVAWIYKVCKNPFSIGYLPVLKLPMTALIDQKRNELSVREKVFISGSALLTNLFIFILGIILLIYTNIFSSYYLRIFILLFIISNFAELTSYVTIGAIKPISDIKYIIEACKISRWKIYIPGFILLVIGVIILRNYVLRSSEFGYFVYYLIIYLTLVFSRIILTKTPKEEKI